MKPLEKRVPKNPKYEHVKGKLKTGPNLSQVEVMSYRIISKCRGELFNRIRPTTLAKLITGTFEKKAFTKLSKRRQTMGKNFRKKTFITWLNKHQMQASSKHLLRRNKRRRNFQIAMINRENANHVVGFMFPDIPSTFLP